MQVKHLIRGTFKEFLTRHKLNTLEPLFHAIHTMQGYGHIDEISALYGLMWNAPKLMCSMMASMKGKHPGKLLANRYLYRSHSLIPRSPSFIKKI